MQAVLLPLQRAGQQVRPKSGLMTILRLRNHNVRLLKIT